MCEGPVDQGSHHVVKFNFPTTGNEPSAFFSSSGKDADGGSKSESTVCFHFAFFDVLLCRYKRKQIRGEKVDFGRHKSRQGTEKRSAFDVPSEGKGMWLMRKKWRHE